MRRSWVPSVAGLLVVGLLAAGCGEEAKTLDRVATQRAVGRAVAPKVIPAVAATTCPADLPRAKGHRFTCTITLGNKAGDLKVSVIETDADGSLQVEVLAAVLSGKEIGTQVKAALKNEFGRSFQVDCGASGYQVRPPGSVLECTARDQSSRRKVKVTVTDKTGTLEIAVPKPTK